MKEKETSNIRKHGPCCLGKSWIQYSVKGGLDMDAKGENKVEDLVGNFLTIAKHG